MKSRLNGGFTVIEVIVVIAIVVILAGVVIGNLVNSRDKARDTKRVSDLEQITLALRLYAEANDDYPSVSGQLGTGGAVDTALAPFLPNVPQDPRHDGATFYYYYDRDVECGGDDRVVLYARTMETTQFANGGSTGCASPASDAVARTIIVAETPS